MNRKLLSVSVLLRQRIVLLHQRDADLSRQERTAAVSCKRKISQIINSQILENNRREIESWNG